MMGSLPSFPATPDWYICFSLQWLRWPQRKNKEKNCKGWHRLQNTFWKPSTIESRQKTHYLTFILPQKVAYWLFSLNLVTLFSFLSFFNKRSYMGLNQWIILSVPPFNRQKPLKTVQDAQNFWLQVPSERPLVSSSPLPQWKLQPVNCWKACLSVVKQGYVRDRVIIPNTFVFADHSRNYG